MSDVVVTPTTPEVAAVTPESTPEGTPTGTPESTPEAPKAPSKRKVKANGREVEIDEADIDRYLSMGLSANEKWQDAAKMKKEADALQKQIEENPFKYLQSKNPKLREQAEEWLLEKIQEDELSPEQKELKKYKEKDAQEAERAKQLEEEAKNQQLQEAEQKFVKQFSDDLATACTKLNVPRSPDFVKRVASKMSDALDNDVELTPEDAVALVRDDYVADIKHFLSGVEDLLPYLGDEIASKLRKSDLARVKSPHQVSKDKTPPEASKKVFRNIDEMREEAARILDKM